MIEGIFVDTSVMVGLGIVIGELVCMAFINNQNCQVPLQLDNTVGLTVFLYLFVASNIFS